MKKADWKWSQWSLLAGGWLIVTFILFYLSERFKDIDAVLYPSVFLLILSMLLGPGLIAGMLPPPKTPEDAALRRIAPFFSYIICYALIAGLTRLFLRMGWV
ncbi:MAG: hypothetical protein IKS42_08515 [Oscillospiraceae bacterium]|nr:hypothetical protein [Oscillospiraceae bacterium]